MRRIHSRDTELWEIPVLCKENKGEKGQVIVHGCKTAEGKLRYINKTFSFLNEKRASHCTLYKRTVNKLAHKYQHIRVLNTYLIYDP